MNENLTLTENALLVAALADYARSVNAIPVWEIAMKLGVGVAFERWMLSKIKGFLLPIPYKADGPIFVEDLQADEFVEAV